MTSAVIGSFFLIGFDKIIFPPSKTKFTNLLTHGSSNKNMLWYHFYDIYFNKFKSWCLQFKRSHLPALSSTVSMYLTSLIHTGVSVAILNSIFYAVKCMQSRDPW
jgi:hypothetical protein